LSDNFADQDTAMNASFRSRHGRLGFNLENASASVLLVSSADKLHKAGKILADNRASRV
jgi:hypothetical protein